MHFKQFYLGCLSHASYLIGSNGEAAVVDPQRDVQQYIDEAEAHGLRIRYVLETHLHADFVSGHRELAALTGAEIVFGHRAGAEFPHVAVHDGEELRIGDVVLLALETPGHTPEGISWVAIDTAEPDAPRKVFTGDTLFIGDVGRPDLVGSKGYSAEEMASLLYDSIHRKLLTLDDEVEVYPAHGAGSACGRNISSDRSSTIGEQRLTNYALRPMTREQFISLMTSDLPEAPGYFSMDAEINRRGAGMLSEIAVAALTPAEANKAMQQGALVLDVRDSTAFANGHIPGSVNIGLKGSYAPWSGSLIKPSDRLILVADGKDEIDEAVMRLARVGLENVAGYLDGGILAWNAAGLELETTPQISVAELHARLQDGDTPLQVIDVRAEREYATGRVPGAKNVPLPELEARLATDLDPSRPTAVVCAGGYRSAAAASLLQRHGFKQLYNIIGGTSAWESAGYQTER
ncbi:MAG TPA: rhodanese-like domain-containing protein [Thermoanaerobaculia bacterium]|nr:rhodanese-like domain-containing protein [Thermoanaerobaculia bacterium]